MSRHHRLPRLVVAAYPPSFRQRYGEELAALVADNASSGRDTVDLMLGACRAWVSPSVGGDTVGQRRARLQTTTITVLAAWCASLLAAATFSKAVDDPRLPGMHGVAWTALDAGSTALMATETAVLVTGFGFWLLVMAPAVRARRRDVVLPALAPAFGVTLWLSASALVALFVHHNVRSANVSLTWPRGAVLLAVLLGWVAVTMVCVMICAAGASIALRRAEMPLARLAASTAVAAIAAVGITVQAVAALLVFVHLLQPRGGLDPRDAVFSAGSTAVLVAVTLIAAVSVVRGLRALRSGPPGWFPAT